MDNLIERYIHDVTRRLPENQRKDVSMELKVTIEDMVASKVDKKINESEAIKSVLEELGNPEQLAANYTNSKEYLIGPKWFSAYKKTISIIVTYTVPFALTIQLLLKLTESSNDLFSIFIGAILGTINAVIGLIFSFTLVFALIDRMELDVPELEQKWTIDMLPQIPASRQVSKFDAWMELITSFITFGFVFYFVNNSIFNLATWQSIGIAVVVILVLELIHQFAMLVVGNWNLLMTITGIGLNLALSIVAVVAFSHSIELINPEIISNMQANGISNAVDVVSIIIKIVTVSVIFICGWQSFDAARMYIKYRAEVKMK